MKKVYLTFLRRLTFVFYREIVDKELDLESTINGLVNLYLC